MSVPSGDHNADCIKSQDWTEIYQSYSAKLSLAIENVLRPLFASGGKYGGKVKVIFRLQVQPWHGSSTFTHEAALAVARVSPENFWSFSLAVRLLVGEDRHADRMI